MPYLSQEEINKMYENNPQPESNSEKEESKDNFIARERKGTLVRVMRRNSIVLYLIMTTLVAIIFIYTVIKTGYVVDLTQSSPLILLTTWLIVSLITDKKKKLDAKVRWYKNKWGWFEFIMLLNVVGLILSLSLPFLAIQLAKNNNNLNLLNNQQNNINREISKEEINKKYIYRDITQAEINNFIPINYETINDVTGAVLIKKFIINDINEYVLPLLPKNEFEGMVKIILLKYDKKSNNYYILDEYNGSGNVGVNFENIDDIDGDNIDEFFIYFSESYGAATGNHLEIFKIQEEGIVKLGTMDMLNENYFSYNENSKEITVANYIWGENESHYGCHYFTIEKYYYKEGGIVLKDKKNSKFKYDMGDGQYDNIVCMKFMDNFNDFLMKENYLN